jgi:uncharacterized LabA/DUF88 family protein
MYRPGMDPQITGQSMVFVDGTNVLVTLFKILELDRALRAHRPGDSALRLATGSIGRGMHALYTDGQLRSYQLVRRHWFGSVPVDEAYAQGRREVLRTLGYDAHLIQQNLSKGDKEKGVDLAVARKMLTHGFRRNYDAAVLVAGDEDYVGLVEDLKDQGLLVFGVFYSTGLSPRLKLAFDRFVDLTQFFPAVQAAVEELRAETATSVGQ